MSVWTQTTISNRKIKEAFVIVLFHKCLICVLFKTHLKSELNSSMQVKLLSTQLDYIFLTNSWSDCVSLWSTSSEIDGKPSVMCHLKWMWYVLCLVCTDPHQQSYRFPPFPFQWRDSRGGCGSKCKEKKNENMTFCKLAVRVFKHSAGETWSLFLLLSSRSHIYTQNKQTKLLCLCRNRWRKIWLVAITKANN